MNTGARIRQLRIDSLMTQRELATKLGVDPVTVSRWERGHALSELNRVRVARLFDVDPRTLKAKAVA